VENSLRLFIEKVLTDSLGGNYWTQVNISNSVKTSIQARKNAEQKNQWISLRGDSELFYLDFKDLSALITNNWDYFKNYFPDKQWITVKIEELENCRNLVAHNSYIGQLEREVIRVNYNQILRQIEKVKATNPMIEEVLPF
jgi:hypothetical protein